MGDLATYLQLGVWRYVELCGRKVMTKATLKSHQIVPGAPAQSSVKIGLFGTYDLSRSSRALSRSCILDLVPI
jgi:hypothetical protein